ncbi:MAG: hypothetical protein JW727_02390 [Candidatus Aenigmarchaeota archaeon]|nr:hypothetical protein [Candidatus Aenigmarchaeota archaeon]
MVEIVESFLMSRKGMFDGGEDRLITGPNFFGVCDGVPDKTGLSWGEKPSSNGGGGFALSDLVKGFFESEESHGIAPEKAVDLLSKKVRDAAAKSGVDLSVPHDRAAVGFMAYNAQKREIWHVGGVSYGTLDSKGAFRQHRFDAPVDRLMGKVRAAVSDWYIKEGGDPFEGGRDRGREFIEPFLRRQVELQNLEVKSDEVWLPGIPKRMVSFRVINGFPTKISVFSVPLDILELTFATDGLGAIRPSWDLTRKAWLKHLRVDPHHIHLIKATKGLMPGNKSFDDIAYIRIRL